MQEIQMKPMMETESWETVSQRVYWDRDVALEKWKDMVSKGHRSYLPDAVTGMSVSEFVHFYGVTIHSGLAACPRLFAGKCFQKSGCL